MDKIIEKLNLNIQTVPKKYMKLGEAALLFKPTSGKWSKKEILGHLIDSALNNHRRIVMVQYQPGVKIVYDQNQWVRIQRYQNMEVEDLIQMWIIVNRKLILLIENFPKAMLYQSIDTGKNTVELCTAEYLITDYLAHMEHHLSQIFD